MQYRQKQTLYQGKNFPVSLFNSNMLQHKSSIFLMCFFKYGLAFINHKRIAKLRIHMFKAIRVMARPL